jgi:hypothetical protein
MSDIILTILASEKDSRQTQSTSLWQSSYTSIYKAVEKLFSDQLTHTGGRQKDKLFSDQLTHTCRRQEDKLFF